MSCLQVGSVLAAIGIAGYFIMEDHFNNLKDRQLTKLQETADEGMVAAEKQLMNLKEKVEEAKEELKELVAEDEADGDSASGGSTSCPLPAGWTVSMVSPTTKAFKLFDNASVFLGAMNACLAEGGRLATATDGTELGQILSLGE